MRAAGKGAALRAPGGGDGTGAVCLWRLAGLAKLREQRPHDFGVELRSRGSTQLRARLLVLQLRAVGPLHAHRCIRVAGRNDARAERNVLAHESLRISVAVPAL